MLYLKFRKIQIIMYIHDWNEFLTKCSSKPIKTAVKTIYTWLLYKINRKHTQNIKWLV